MSLIDTLNKVKPLGVEFVNLSDELRRFRVRLEGEADDVPLHLLHLNAAEMLSDLIAFLGMGKRVRDAILGEHNIRYLETMESITVKPTVKH